MSAKREWNAEKGLKSPIRSQMLNEMSLKCWKGSQITYKVSNVECNGVGKCYGKGPLWLGKPPEAVAFQHFH